MPRGVPPYSLCAVIFRTHAPRDESVHTKSVRARCPPQLDRHSRKHHQRALGGGRACSVLEVWEYEQRIAATAQARLHASVPGLTPGGVTVHVIRVL